MEAKAVPQKALAYVRGVREELQKVTWPTRKQATRYSVLVVVISTVVAVFFTVLDLIFNLGLEQLLKLS